MASEAELKKMQGSCDKLDSEVAVYAVREYDAKLNAGKIIVKARIAFKATVRQKCKQVADKLEKAGKKQKVSRKLNSHSFKHTAI